MHLNFDNSYARLPDRFYVRQKPVPVRSPQLMAWNTQLAGELGIDKDTAEAEASSALFAGNSLPDGAEPLAQAYAGHQFGNFVPQLGDGRALLLGEVITHSGTRRDLQLKGSGITPFSRGGDGRSWIGPVVREYIVSEAMHAMGIPTTRALAAVRTGETVFRESALPGGVLTRVAASHIRVGTFQYFAARDDYEAVRLLADHVVARHYPEAKDSDNPYLSLLRGVMENQASLVARWMGVGFIHGVMNTDNMAVSGETIDYGPCAFMESYDPNTVFSSIDRNGRYAYGQQSSIAVWNLARLAETLLPLIDFDQDKAIALAEELLDEFAAAFQAQYLKTFRKKLGLFTEAPGDGDLIQHFLNILEDQAADFTQSFRKLTALTSGNGLDETLKATLASHKGFDAWQAQWSQRLDSQPQSREEVTDLMNSANPALIPRNHLVERAIQKSLTESDDSLMREMVEVFTKPFKEQEKYDQWMLPARPEEQVLKTFCGT